MCVRVCVCLQRKRQRQGDSSQQNSKTTARLADGYAEAAWLAMRANPFPPEQAVTGQGPRQREDSTEERDGKRDQRERGRGGYEEVIGEETA